jgi:hypothetical protein
MDPAFPTEQVRGLKAHGMTNGFDSFTASQDSSSSNAFASFRSAVSKPSVNQP